jgi:hypothetical protein
LAVERPRRLAIVCHAEDVIGNVARTCRTTRLPARPTTRASSQELSGKTHPVSDEVGAFPAKRLRSHALGSRGAFFGVGVWGIYKLRRADNGATVREPFSFEDRAGRWSSMSGPLSVGAVIGGLVGFGIAWLVQGAPELWLQCDWKCMAALGSGISTGSLLGGFLGAFAGPALEALWKKYNSGEE